ncbi:MAG: polyisoprenoid-binding protein [Deltaproteobacteria bacterium]|nr:polyisoprenoid-binding protein [Deltaproteobacteria bacterium]
MSHRTLVVAAVFAAGLVAPLTARAADTYEIDGAHASVQFSVRHMMISNVRGEFTKVSGTATGDPGQPTATTVEATIDAASIDTRNAKRDEHLRGPEFLDTAKFPTIGFTSTKVEKAGEGWKLTGNLTLHGVTKPVVLDVTNVTPPVKDPWGNTRIGAQAATKLNRRDFGIVFNKALDGGGVLVGDEIAVTIDVEVMKKGGAK